MTDGYIRARDVQVGARLLHDMTGAVATVTRVSPCPHVDGWVRIHATHRDDAGEPRETALSYPPDDDLELTP